MPRRTGIKSNKKKEDNLFIIFFQSEEPMQKRKI